MFNIKKKLRLLHGKKAESLKPILKSRYDHLLGVFRDQRPFSMVEIGVWRGDSTVRFLSEGVGLRRYFGFDVFDAITDERFNCEKMGRCVPPLQTEVAKRINSCEKPDGCSVDLISGYTEDSLPEFAKNHAGTCDFIYIDGGHSLETIENDWKYAKEIVSSNGLIVFDDYYLNNTDRGAKPLIDKLIKDNEYRVHFFPMIEDIIEGLQVTMVEVRPK